MEELLALRFADRDRIFAERLTQLKQRMAARGILYSSSTLQEGHTLLKDEYNGSVQNIVVTYSDSLREGDATQLDQPRVAELSRQRREHLEQIFSSSMSPVTGGLSNTSMWASFMSLEQAEPLQTRELQLAITKAWEDFQSSQGATLHERTMNKFRNNPIFVWGMIVMAGIGAILAFLELVGWI